MKKHITIEQLNEVNIDNILKNFSIGNRNGYAISFDRHGKEIADLVLIEGMTIGKMIEMLDKYFPLVQKDSDGISCDWWEVSLYKSSPNSKAFVEINRFKSKELVDALWESVKYVLDKE